MAGEAALSATRPTPVDTRAQKKKSTLAPGDTSKQTGAQLFNIQIVL